MCLKILNNYPEGYSFILRICKNLRFSGCNQICTENQLLNGVNLMNNKKIIFDIVMYIIFGVIGLYLVSKTDFGTGVFVFIAILYLAAIAYKVKQVFSNSDS